MASASRVHERMSGRTQEFGHVTGKGLEAMTAWTDANQRLWRELVQLWADATRENLRFLAHLQSRAMELATVPVAGGGQLQKDAADWYRKAVRDSMERFHQALDALAEDGGRSEWVGGWWPGGRGREALRGQWRELRGQIRQQWDKLTDDELDRIQGNTDLLVGKLQEHYGKSREQAEQELDRWLEQQRLPRAS